MSTATGWRVRLAILVLWTAACPASAGPGADPTPAGKRPASARPAGGPQPGRTEAITEAIVEAHKPHADGGTILEFWAKSEQLRQVTFSRERPPAPQ